MWAIIFQVEKKTTCLLPMCDWEWPAFYLLTYFSRQWYVVGVYESWGCGKVPVKSEDVSVALNPILADFEQSLVPPVYGFQVSVPFYVFGLKYCSVHLSMEK